MTYECKICDYIVESKSAFSHHKKSKKHLEKVTQPPTTAHTRTEPAGIQSEARDYHNLPKTKNIMVNVIQESSKKLISNSIPILNIDNSLNKLICNMCNISFTRADTLVRHQKKYCAKREILEIKQKCDETIKNKEMELLKTQFEELKKQFDEIKKEKDKQIEEKGKLEDQLLYYRDLSISKNNDSSMTNLNFLNTYFTNAPALEDADEGDFHKIFKSTKTNKTKDEYYENLGNEILNLYENNKLHILISEYILKKYCMKDKMKQSVWNSDATRLNYIIRKTVKEDNMWIMDKCGVNLLEKIIRPINDYIKKQLGLIQNYLGTELQNSNDAVNYFEKWAKAAVIIKEVNDGVFENKILKELTKYFNIDQKLLLKDVIKKEVEENKDDKKEIKKKKMIKDVKETSYLEDMDNITYKIDLQIKSLTKKLHNISSDTESDDDDEYDRMYNKHVIEEKIKKLENDKKNVKNMIALGNKEEE